MSAVDAPRALTPAGRTVRTAVLGGSSLGLAAGAHLAGGGALPGPMVLVGLTALLGMLATAVTAKRCTWRRLAAVMSLAQFGLHVVFALAAPMRGMGVATSAGRSHLTMHTSLGLAGCMPSATMLLTHLVALAVTVWLLARGEAWFWRVLQALGRPPAGRRPRARARVAVIVSRTVLRARITGSAALTRGPPVLPAR